MSKPGPARFHLDRQPKHAIAGRRGSIVTRTVEKAGVQMSRSTPGPAVTLEHPFPGVRLLTLNRPRLRNAMTEEVTRAWREAIAEVRSDHSVRALVITGAGTSFCSGADLSWLDSATDQDRTVDRLRDTMLEFYQSWLAPRELPFPVIAAVNGPTVGAGLALALACDLRYAATGASFSAPFLYLGTHGGMGITALLPEIIGQARTRELLFTGRTVSATEVCKWGLVSAVADDVLELALETAQRIASAAPVATRLTKSGLNRLASDVAAALSWEGLAQPVTLTTADLHEGISARRAGREPKFEGR
jgi:enoyl-CoA hydratase/carnithine racemase